MKKGKLKSKIKKTSNKELIKLDLPKRIVKEKPELIHANPFQSGETIVESIIDKIIKLSVRQSYLNTLDKVHKNYYYNYIHTQLNTLFAINNIFYYDEPKSNTKDKLFWNKSYDKTNTWVEITEPNSSKIDRYENIFMKYVNYVPPPENKIKSKKSPNSLGNTLTSGELLSNNRDELIDSKLNLDSNNKFSIKIKNMLNKEGNNILDILEEKSSASSKDEYNNRSSTKKITKLRKNINPLNTVHPPNKKKSISPMKEPSKNNTSLSPQNDLVNDIINENNDGTVSKNKNLKKQPILPMNPEEIPGIDKEFNFDMYSPPNVERLRRQIEEAKIRKQKEKKNIKKITVNENNENDIKNKIIDSNKLTFDSNGKIINFKPIKIENLSKDFTSIRNGIKPPENSDNKNITKNFNNSKRKIKNNKSTEPKKNQPSKEKEKEEEEKKESEKENEVVIKNPDDALDEEDKFNFAKPKPEKREQVIPSGSNFTLLLPNIGVTFKENDQIKEGTRDFSKYFKKYSLKDYDRILREFLPLQNKTMLKNKINQSNNVFNTINTMNLTSKKIPINYTLNSNTNYNNSSTSLGNSNNINNINNNNITELTNPLMNQQETIQENDTNTINNNNNSSLIKTAKSNISYLNSPLYSKIINNRSNFSETHFIRLNKNCSSTSLKNEIENVEDLNEEGNLNFYPSKIKLNSRNIFQDSYKEFYKNKRSINIKTNIHIGKNMNELNRKIMINDKWGNQILQNNKSTENLLYSKHLTKYQALRELGSNLLNGIKVKLPRDRKVDINI